MQDNLVIVESPAKAKTIEKYLGKDFKVMSSYGHIRDLKTHSLSIDTETMMPVYEIPKEKKQVVSELKKAAKQAKKVWLASDEDREGEAISWHLCEVLGLNEEETSRIVFHEITKNAILGAIENPRHLDMNLVNAQQARRVLDRLVGFRLSPILWKKIRPSLSAGRVQSVAVRLIVEREREINNFNSEPYYRVNAIFRIGDTDVKAAIPTRMDEKQARAFLEKCRNAVFTIDSIETKPARRKPQPPFTTSTLQQEASRRLGFTVTQTMRIAQSLYEAGKITYMRTDSVNLSSLCIGASKETIIQMYGEEYSCPRNFQTSSKGAQEAHEAIRPTYMDKSSAGKTSQEKRLYGLIWKRAIASQMAEAELERTVLKISVDGEELHFVAEGEVMKFDGFLKVYQTSSEEAEDDSSAVLLPQVTLGQQVERQEIVATERYSQPPSRYSEATLVKKMEELGIGRPSTYAPTISTIQQRQYVVHGDSDGKEREAHILTLQDDTITETSKAEHIGADKKKLLPTDIGIVVNDFLMQHFPNILDFGFTASVETQFDTIAEGQQQWEDMLKDFNKDFETEVEHTLSLKEEHRVGERVLGVDESTGKPISVKIGRFGPVLQMGSAEDAEKPRFAQLPKHLTIETVRLEDVKDLFRLPRTLGEFEGSEVTVGTSRFGAYVLHDKKYITIPKDEDPMAITLERAIEMIEEKRNASLKKLLQTFEEDENIQVLMGKFGPYIRYKGRNYGLPKELHERVGKLTLEECLNAVKAFWK